MSSTASRLRSLLIFLGVGISLLLVALVLIAPGGVFDFPHWAGDKSAYIIGVTTDVEYPADRFRGGVSTLGHEVKAGNDTAGFSYNKTELPESFKFKNQSRDVEEFLNSTKTTSLVAVKNGTIRVEKYYHGYDEDSKILSWSLAKPFVSSLIGIAIDEGHIDSIDDPADKYVPELKGSGYEGVPIKYILNFSSGVGFEEEYQKWGSDSTQMHFRRDFGKSPSEYVTELERVREPGKEVNYKSSDSQVVIMVLRNAIDQPVHEYMEEKLWKPAGMESDMEWAADYRGEVLGYTSMYMNARDYARLGHLYLNKGRIDGKQVIPEEWVEKSTLADSNHSTNSEKSTKGYSWTITPVDDDYYMLGLGGQYIHVNKRFDTVIVKTAADRDFQKVSKKNWEFLRQLAAKL